MLADKNDQAAATMNSFPRDEKKKENQRQQDGSRDDVVGIGEKADEIDEPLDLALDAEAKRARVNENDHNRVEGSNDEIKAVLVEGIPCHDKIPQEGESEPTLQDVLLPALSLSRQERLGPPEELLRPGAYRMHEGEIPHRASSVGSSDRTTERSEQLNRPAPSEEPPEQTFLAEARLVEENAPTVVTSPHTSLLVAATPVRRSHQIAIVIAAVVIAAAITGMAVGLTRDRSPPSPATLSPTSSPTSAATDLFATLIRSTLPPQTIESLQDTSSPQYLAYDWVVENYEALGLDAQSDEDLQHATQLFALATLYFATGGEEDSWENKDLWLSVDFHECKWHGCCCGENCSEINEKAGPLTWLDLRAIGLTHSIPREIALLTHLKSLTLSNNTISGSVPTELGQLSAITALGLSSNQLAGTIPSELGRLTNLVALSVGNNNLSGSIPTELGQLSALTNLYLWNNRLTSAVPSELGLLKNTKDLQLHNNLLTGPIPPELGQLSVLSNLYIYENKLTSTVPTELGSLTDLTFLSLSRNKLSGPIPTELSYLSALTGLYLLNNQINSTIPSELSLMKNMEDLQLQSNLLTGSIPTELCELSALTKLYLFENRLTSTIPPHLGNVTLLADLGLNANNLTGPIPTQLGELFELTSLWLGPNRLNSTIPSELGRLSKLEASFPILLGNNYLSGSVPSELCQLKLSNRFDLFVDCEEVSCACGCSCSPPSDDVYYYRSSE
jgi:Leucine-rich repeat (LRR) protein